MKMRLRDAATAVGLIVAAALPIGVWSWAAGDADGARSLPEVGRTDSHAPSNSEATSHERTVETRAARRESNAAAPKRDPLLDSLRSKLEAPNVVPGEALLTFRSAEARERFAQQAATLGLEVLDIIPQLNSSRVHYGRLEDLHDAISRSTADYAGVEGNLWLSIPAVSPVTDPNNQGGRTPFGSGMLNAINASGDRTQWGADVTVAVLDTGVLAHPTFADGQVTHLDLVNDGQSFHSHGTSVASLIAGQHRQAPGVAAGAHILDVRVTNAEGISVASTLAQGIITAADRGAQVINISLGGYGESALLGQAVGYALQRGTVVVAAAGNDAYGQLAIPAAYHGVLSVGSVDANNRQAYFSNAGAGLDLAAPGVGVVSAWDTDKVALVSGTSQSSALVAGAVATYLAWRVPSSEVAARLQADARPAAGAAGAGGSVGTLMIKPPTGL